MGKGGGRTRARTQDPSIKSPCGCCRRRRTLTRSPSFSTASLHYDKSRWRAMRPLAPR
jgi:hypothetical protein